VPDKYIRMQVEYIQFTILEQIQYLMEYCPIMNLSQSAYSFVLSPALLPLAAKEFENRWQGGDRRV
jgi:hypothetical protein